MVVDDGGKGVYRGDVVKLLEKIDREHGVDLARYRRQYLERRLAVRLRALGLHSYRQYARHLDEHPEEHKRLLDALSINVTEFFRDPSVFEMFRSSIVPAMIADKMRGRHRMIRVWSAGCATGEEPYSIAMTFLDAFKRIKGGPILSVIGTDIDEQALKKAREARYDIGKIDRIPKDLRMQYVDVAGDTFTISPEVVDTVRFRPLNLFDDKPIGTVDVIFCRNVFIYFDRLQQERALGIFIESLSRGGYLVLGRTERMVPELAARMELVSGRERIYRKPASI